MKNFNSSLKVSLSGCSWIWIFLLTWKSVFFIQINCKIHIVVCFSRNMASKRNTKMYNIIDNVCKNVYVAYPGGIWIVEFNLLHFLALLFFFFCRISIVILIQLVSYGCRIPNIDRETVSPFILIYSLHWHEWSCPHVCIQSSSVHCLVRKPPDQDQSLLQVQKTNRGFRLNLGAKKVEHASALIFHIYPGGEVVPATSLLHVSLHRDLWNIISDIKTK